MAGHSRWGTMPDNTLARAVATFWTFFSLKSYWMSEPMGDREGTKKKSISLLGKLKVSDPPLPLFSMTLILVPPPPPSREWIDPYSGLTLIPGSTLKFLLILNLYEHPPPPTPLKPQMKVDFVWMWIPHMGNARNLRYSRAPLHGARRRSAGISFSTWACASRRQAPSSFVHHAEGRRRFRLGVSSSVGHCCQHFWVGWWPNQIKGGLLRGKCQRDKQALQIFLGRLQLDDADVVVYKGSKTPRPSYGKFVLDVHGTRHLDKHGRRCM